MNVEFCGTGSYVPEKIVTNEDMSSMVDTSDEWIFSRTGIKERRIASDKESTSSMAAKAAKKALNNAKLSAEEIDLIIVATLTPDSFIPSTACKVQSIIGAVNATCFDISAACSGFLFALDTAFQYIKTCRFNCALIIGAEKLSKVVNWKDRNTCVLFGDGAGAAILKGTKDKKINSFYTGSNGDKSEFLTCHIGENKYVEMNGKEIFKFAASIIPECVTKVTRDAGIDLEHIKYIVPHQANTRIIQCSAKKLGIPIEKFYLNLNKYGNTSAASIALALDEINTKGLLEKDDIVILTGFGGGLTFGAALIQW